MCLWRLTRLYSRYDDVLVVEIVIEQMFLRLAERITLLTFNTVGEGEKNGKMFVYKTELNSKLDCLHAHCIKEQQIRDKRHIRTILSNNSSHIVRLTARKVQCFFSSPPAICFNLLFKIYNRGFRLILSSLVKRVYSIMKKNNDR